MSTGRSDPPERRRRQKAAQVRPQGRSLKVFYVALAAIVLVGFGLIAWSARRSSAFTPRVLDVPVTAAQAEGYLLGNPKAPVQIYEFADFECPACASFATITEPDVRKNIVQAGLASYRYFDFPLQQHHNSLAASVAASCAADQGKFWEMHDKLFYNQPEWNTEATNSPQKYFERYATEIGLDMNAWKTCFKDQRHMARILANRAEGERRHVESTPTFVIGNHMVAGALSYDQFKALVDSAAKNGGPADSAAAPASR